MSVEEGARSSFIILMNYQDAAIISFLIQFESEVNQFFPSKEDITQKAMSRDIHLFLRCFALSRSSKATAD